MQMKAEAGSYEGCVEGAEMDLRGTGERNVMSCIESGGRGCCLPADDWS